MKRITSILALMASLASATTVDFFYDLDHASWTGGPTNWFASFGAPAAPSPVDAFPQAARIVGMWHGKHSAGLNSIRTNTGTDSNLWVDISGNGYPIVLNSWKMTEEDGWTNGWLHADGTDTCCATGTVSASVATTSNMTVLVIYRKPAASRTGYLFHDENQSKRISVYHDSANIGIYTDFGAVNTFFDTEKATATWQSMAVTIQGTNNAAFFMQMYYDKTLSTARGQDNKLLSPMPYGAFTLGSYSGGSVRFLGDIAFCAIWDCWLDASEVADAHDKAFEQLGL